LRLNLIHILLRALVFLLAFAILHPTRAQQAPQKPSEKSAGKPSTPPEKVENPAQIELLETRYRFETDGSSRKEVHTRVHINSELGVRQFARLNFDFNRAFQSIEIPLVHITHASGGTADILPSAITDNPNPAVVNAPAYQDVRVKTVRILGLEPGDTLEYRVITTVSHHPLAPDFWLDHSFDRTGVVSQEIFTLDLPASREVQIRISPATPATSTEKSGEGDSAHNIYRWERTAAHNNRGNEAQVKTPDVMVTTFSDWNSLSVRLAESLRPLKSHSEETGTAPEILERAKSLTGNAKTSSQKLEAVYDFVSQKIATVDLPLGSTGFVGRPARDILASRYATPEDKYVLFASLIGVFGPDPGAELVGSRENIIDEPPRPSPFDHIVIGIALVENNSLYWLDPSLEVAPFNVLPANHRGVQEFFVARKPPVTDVIGEPWDTIPDKLPFPSSQNVAVDAWLGADGKLTAKVHYSLRGDNELLLRVAFHQAPKDKWKDLAQLLSLSDGFRGEVSSVSASDPYATREPFTLDYEITQPKFVDWSKKPVRIPALLPQLGLPDPPAKPAAGSATAPVELGTPLEVETHMTLHLPPGTAARTPTGIAVVRDYATFASQYAARELTVTASRHINFLSREVPADRAADYNAFLRAVQSDEAQDFTLERPDAAKAKPAPATERPLPAKP
jgi:Domain of Unknown Function with PDB structure (DUF3857)